MIPMTREFCGESQRHASLITPICLGNRTELEHKRFVPLALLFPIARRYWKSKPVAHKGKMRNIITSAVGRTGGWGGWGVGRTSGWGVWFSETRG